MDLGDVRGEDLASDVDGGPDDGEDADVDALDTDDEAEDQALGIDAEESDGELPVLLGNQSDIRPQSRCTSYRYTRCSLLKDK